MSEDGGRASWDERHRGQSAGGSPELFVLEMMSLFPQHGLVLDLAAGRGRHSLFLAHKGFRVVAVDYSEIAVSILADAANREALPIWPVIANLDSFPFTPMSFDLILNVNYLDRELFPHLRDALKPRGVLVAETFLVDQAELGHPKNPDFLLKHHELRSLMGNLELVRYREGLTVYPDGKRAWRAGALAQRRM